MAFYGTAFPSTAALQACHHVVQHTESVFPSDCERHDEATQDQEAPCHSTCPWKWPGENWDTNICFMVLGLAYLRSTDSSNSEVKEEEQEKNT